MADDGSAEMADMEGLRYVGRGIVQNNGFALAAHGRAVFFTLFGNFADNTLCKRRSVHSEIEISALRLNGGKLLKTNRLGERFCNLHGRAAKALGKTDNEGFAGDNNRTTIFDYWSLDTVRRWYNNGECDGAHLTSQEKWLRSTYSKILSICNTEKAISEGTFFDLMYVNLNNPEFNPHRQFAFLRHHGEDTLMIVANFDHQAANLKVNIPNEAFDYMDLPDGQGLCVELLSGTRQIMRLTRGERFDLSVGANSAVIWRIRKKNFKPI